MAEKWRFFGGMVAVLVRYYLINYYCQQSIETASKQHTKCRGTGRKSRQLILEEKLLKLAVDIKRAFYT